jgi:hypothetical protein
MTVVPIPQGWRRTELHFGGEVFRIFSDQFSELSSRFRNSCGTLTSVEFDDRVSVASMRDFVSFIHNDDFNITPANYPDLRTLADSYEVATLKIALKRFLEDPTNARQVVISSIISGVQNDRKTAQEEDILSNHLNDYLDDPAILNIPLPILDRIVSPQIQLIQNPQKFPNDLFQFALRAVRQIDSASVLLRGLSLETLSADQLRELCNCREFDWSFLQERAGQSIAEWLQKQAPRATVGERGSEIECSGNSKH